MGKKILLGLIAVLVIIQFVRPEKNLSDDRSYDVATKYNVPDSIKVMMDVACNDCHSNKTEYPWYAEIQPIGWWMNSHVEHGKRHLNYSEFTKRKLAWQNHKFEETIEMVKEKEMPIASYTWLGLHSAANLTDTQRESLIAWAQAQMDTLKATYPADSLVRKK